MKDKIRICMIGCGGFCAAFVPILKAHPAVEKVYVCDLIRERAEGYAQKFDVEVIDSFEAALASDKVNSVAIFAQRDRHGKLAIRALEAGKNVYSAVPCTIEKEDIYRIEELVRKTRLTYSMGETGWYRAATLLVRREFAKGTFGKFVYGEAQYNHDMRNMEEPFRRSGGVEWKKAAGIPPLYYPTHSTAMILSAMPGEYAKQVVGFGFAGSPRTDIFGRGDVNYFDNPYANTAMMMELAGGGIARISENRCIGWKAPETYITQFVGTDGGYEFSVARHSLAHWDPAKHGNVIMEDVTQQVQPADLYELIEKDYQTAIQKIANGEGFTQTSPIQPTAGLPAELHALRNGHNGTHHFMIDDFCRAYTEDKLSPTNIWQVARLNFPGLLAHESAMQNHKVMDVPDLGDPPADWELITPYEYGC